MFQKFLNLLKQASSGLSEPSFLLLSAQAWHDQQLALVHSLTLLVHLQTQHKKQQPEDHFIPYAK